MLQSSKKSVFWIVPFWILFCTFGSSDPGRARRSPALSVLGGEADCVISAHHRAARRA